MFKKLQEKRKADQETEITILTIIAALFGMVLEVWGGAKKWT